MDFLYNDIPPSNKTNIVEASVSVIKDILISANKRISKTEDYDIELKNQIETLYIKINNIEKDLNNKLENIKYLLFFAVAVLLIIMKL